MATNIRAISGGGVTPSGTYTVEDDGTWDVTNYQYVEVPSGSVNTPTATKSAVTNNAVTVTPSVTSVTGWITGGTKSGTSVSVSATELTSGNKPLASSASDQTNIDVTNYKTVSISKIASGTAGTPTATKGTVTNNSVTVTPSVTNTTGYITGGTKTGTGVTVSASELVSNATYSITSTGQKDVTNYKYAQVSDANLTAANIASGKTILGIAGAHAGAKPEQTGSGDHNGTFYPDSGKVFSSFTVALPYYDGSVS